MCHAETRAMARARNPRPIAVGCAWLLLAAVCVTTPVACLDCDALEGVLSSVHAGGRNDGSSGAPVRFVADGGHKSVYTARVGGIGRVVLKVPLHLDRLRAERPVPADDGLVASLSAAAGLPLAEAHAQALASRFRDMFAEAGPNSPLRMMDRDRDGSVSDEELAWFARHSSTLAAHGRGLAGAADGAAHSSAGAGASNVHDGQDVAGEMKWWRLLGEELAGVGDTDTRAAASLVPEVHGQCGNVTIVEWLTSQGIKMQSSDWVTR